MHFVVYILKCADVTFYCGSTNNLEKRLISHNVGQTGARYTRARRPVVLWYVEMVGKRGDALRREAVIKKMARKEKIALCKGYKAKGKIVLPS